MTEGLKAGNPISACVGSKSGLRKSYTQPGAVVKRNLQGLYSCYRPRIAPAAPNASLPILQPPTSPTSASPASTTTILIERRSL